MKITRKLFLTTAFAALLGVGAFAGVASVRESKTAEAKAAGNTYNFYIAVDTSKDVKVYFNAGYSTTDLVDCSKNGETYHQLPVYTASIHDSGQAVNFDQVLVQLFENGNWSEQRTVISNWSPFTHSGQLFLYGSDSWTTYSPDVNPASTTNQFYVYDPTSFLGSTFANIKVYGFGHEETIKPMSWPGTHSGITQTTLGGRSVYSVNLSTSYPSFIINNKVGDDGVQSADLTISGNVGKVLVFENDSGSYHWASQSDFTTDCPASDGYYILGSKTNYLFDGAPKMSSYTTGGNIARYTNYSAAANETIRVKSCFLTDADSRKWGNYVGDDTPFGHLDSNNFLFKKAATVDVYAKYNNSDLQFYLGTNNAYDGYYMVGDAAFISEFKTSGETFKYESGVLMNAASGNNAAVYTFTNSTTITFKARYYSDSNSHWVSNTEKSAEATTHGVTFDNDGNYVVPAGTWSLYVLSNGNTSSLTWGMPLDSYCSKFMTETGKYCDGASTVESDLAIAWGIVKTDWAKLSSADQASLVGTAGDEDGSDAAKVMARYDVIIHEHASFEDFMNRKSNANYSYRASGPIADIVNGSGSTIAIVAITSVSLIALGGYFLFKKKHQ